jgi:hypothetical protein
MSMEKVTVNSTQSPPVGENAAAQVAGTEPQEPTAEELKQAVVKSQAEIKRLQGVLKSQGVTKQDLADIRQEITSTQDFVAEALDKLNEGREGELNEKPTTSYKERLAASRKANAPENQPLDEEAKLFYGYMISQGLTVESPEVREALADNRDFVEAREHLKSTIAGRSEAERKAAITATVQAALKEAGLTQSGVGAPTTGSTGYTLEKVKNMSDEELIANQENILKDMAEGKIK